MIVVFLVAAIGVAMLLTPYAFTVLRGPHILVRVLALNGLGTQVPVLVVLVGLVYQRIEMFVDIALGLLLLNLVTTLLIAKHVRDRGIQ